MNEINEYPNYLGLNHSDVLYLTDALNREIFIGTTNTVAEGSIKRIMQDLKAMANPSVVVSTKPNPIGNPYDERFCAVMWPSPSNPSQLITIFGEWQKKAATPKFTILAMYTYTYLEIDKMVDAVTQNIEHFRPDIILTDWSRGYALNSLLRKQEDRPIIPVMWTSFSLWNRAPITSEIVRESNHSEYYIKILKKNALQLLANAIQLDYLGYDGVITNPLGKGVLTTESLFTKIEMLMTPDKNCEGSEFVYGIAMLLAYFTYRSNSWSRYEI